MEEVARYAMVAAQVARDLAGQFDVIHAHDWLPYFAGIAAMHATEFDRSGENINSQTYAIERAGMEAADRVIAVSNLTRNIIVTRYGIPAEKVVTVHNAVRFAEAECAAPERGVGDKIVTFLGRITRVVGHSMDDTLADGELLAVWSLGYEPEQGDIVVLNKTTADFLEGEAIVKRVIALEGQTVDIDYDAGTVAVDGQVLDEPYILEEMLWPSSSHMQETHFEVPEDSIFVMGDNRNGSTDSRHEWLGAIDEDYILGQAVAVVWPLGRIGLM